MSEQANNRRGAGWLGVGTLTSAEVNALSAAMAGPGTESNRSRAGRHGFAWEPVGDPRQRPSDGRDPDSEAKIHALALDVARSGTCTYAEARAHVEAMLAPRMERLDAAQVREVFKLAVGPCPTPDEADRLYGRGSDLALRIRAAWEVSPRGADGAILAPEMVTERTGPASKRPIPAPGQVWLPPVGAVPADWCASDGTVLIHTTPNLSGFIHVGVAPASEWHAIHVDAMRDPTNGWTCIGVATPHGRVMVGDGFRQVEGSQVERRIMAVVEGTQVRCGFADGDEPVDVPASIFVAAMGRDKGYHRTRYAPARAGERYRCRPSRHVYAVSEVRSGRAFLSGEGPINSIAENPDHAQWERLDPGQGIQRGTLAHAVELANDVHAEWARALGSHAPQGKLGAVEREDAEAVLRQMSTGIGPRYVLAPTEPLTTASAVLGRSFPERYEPPLTLRGTHPQLRALFDAIGRALELPATRHVCAFGEGLTVTVLRDEMLFTPTAQTGLGTAELAGDARGLCALRLTIAQTMANGSATLAHWGAKGPRVEVRREGGPMVVAGAEQASEAPRYQPDAGGGAGAWRWEAGE